MRAPRDFTLTGESNGGTIAACTNAAAAAAKAYFGEIQFDLVLTEAVLDDYMDNEHQHPIFKTYWKARIK